ncbi:DUF4123 domain-containing protein [Burkholderia glumae]
MNNLNTPPAGDTDPTSAQAVEAVVVALREYFRRNREMQCLLLVDPHPRELPAPSKGKPSLADLSRTPLPIVHDAFPAHQLPYLLELDPSAPQFGALLADSVRVALADRRPDAIARGPGQRIGGWLATSAPAQEVAQHLSGQVLQTDDQGVTCALRFYDSRALALQWSVLTLMQRETLLGPVKAWHALDAGARLTAYAGLYPAMQSELALKPEQWAAIRRHGLVNRALALHVSATGRQPDAQAVEVAVAAAARAEHHRLEDRDDKLAFIGHALAWHPHFDRHPRVTQALGEVSPDYFYTAAVSELSMDEIDEIQRGEWYGAPNNNGDRLQA